MKKFWEIIKIAFRILRCFNCAHKNECTYSAFLVYKGISYALTVSKVGEVDKNGN